MCRRGISEPDAPAKASSDAIRDGEDLPPDFLAEPDSQFITVGSIRVHYKEVVPFMMDPSREQQVSQTQQLQQQQQQQQDVQPEQDQGFAVVLIHGFGGGVFAWRHVMEPLAMQCQARVVAFDRPGFGKCHGYIVYK